MFGGIIENMHLNWKWRELVKIVVKKSYFMYREKEKVEKIARMLEIESGGVLVGICTIPVGVAIIVYRGKNYQRPIDGVSAQGHPNGLRPRGLLTKRQAWQRFNQKRRKLVHSLFLFYEDALIFFVSVAILFVSINDVGCRMSFDLTLRRG